MQRLILGALIAFLLQNLAFAHESRPAYLEINETVTGRYDVLWRTPLLSGMPFPVVLRFPAHVRNVTEPALRELRDSLVERRLIDVTGGLGGQRLEFVGLQATISDVLVRVQLKTGAQYTTLVRPTQPWIEIAADRGQLATAKTYFISGIEHILTGIDHLLFVLGLLLLVRTPWMLIKTITAFTLAHSITLAIATFGYAHIPAPPLNVAIALSILFLGVEIVRSWRGQSSFTIRQPWVVAFAFGLLHGFGFASGLTTIGLPPGDIPLALLTFNLGVEAGQLAFVALILLLMRSFAALQMQWPVMIEKLPAYVVGSLGAFWTIERLSVMLGGAG